MSVRAKFVVDSVTHHRYAHGTSVILVPVMADGIPENERFHKATPSGKLEMFIDNPPAADQFTAGKFFYVDFTEVK